MSGQGYQAGVSGEDLALRFLLDRGMELMSRRYRASDGEIDLVMRQDNVLVFVEVKYRPNGRHGDGIISVTPGKRRRIIHAATVYYNKLQDFSLQPRFDVVEITGDGICHIPDAFRL